MVAPIHSNSPIRRDRVTPREQSQNLEAKAVQWNSASRAVKSMKQRLSGVARGIF